MKHLSVLSTDDIKAVHEATLTLLESTGIRLAEPEGVEVLTSAGATYSGGRVYIPPDVVTSCLEKCPENVTLYRRNGDPVIIGSGNRNWHNLGGARDIYEPATQTKRSAKTTDVQEATRLLDALSSPTAITPFYTPQDVPGHLMAIAMYRHAIPFTNKPIHGPGVQNGEEVEYLLRMAEVIDSPERILTMCVSPISPLRFPDQIVQAIMRIAKAGVSIRPLPCPTAGTTAPITLGGALTQQNAEVLASIVLVQSVSPGLPVTYCGRLAMMEPRTALSVWGGVEIGLASAATVQIGHSYNLPVNVYGFATNSHHFDTQNGFERAINALLPALAGADELSGIGELDAGIMGSFAQMVIDNEIAAGLNRVVQGIKVDNETLAVDVITSVIEAGETFLTQTHTSKFLRKNEVFIPQLATRGSWDSWVADGFRDMTIRASEEANRILANHVVPPLERAQEQEINRIYEMSDRELIRVRH